MGIEFDYTAFRRNLRDLIRSNGKTLRDTAADMNISFVTLSRYTNGHRDPDLKYVVFLSQYFNVPIDWLLGLNADRYETMDPKTKDLIALYNISSPDDRRVIDTILSKYRKEK